MSTNREWVVPVTILRTATAYVKATSAEEAIARIDEGKWDNLYHDNSELLSVDIAGEPEES